MSDREALAKDARHEGSEARRIGLAIECNPPADARKRAAPSGSSAMSDAALCSRLQIPQAKAEALTEWQDEAERMREALVAKGYADARVSIEAASSRWIGRQMTLVILSGNRATGTKVVNRGDPWRLAFEAWAYIASLPHGGALEAEFSGPLIGKDGAPL